MVDDEVVVLDCPCPRFCPCTMDAGIGERRKRVSWLSRSGEGVVMAALASASSATLGPDRRTTPGEPWSKAQLDAIGQTMHRLLGSRCDKDSRGGVRKN